jgi:adsorption protein B
VRFEQWLAACLLPLALWILVSGLDDLWISVVSFLAGKEQLPPEPGSGLAEASERRIGVLVPLWREQNVIERMLERNLSAIEYSNYEIFVGVYPNDPQTCRAVAEAAQRHPRVHIVVCPHDGPTSKGDCLNWIYRGMEDYERRNGVRFEVVVTHDAEDLIHPQSLRLINRLSRTYQMVQIPVLPLPTGLKEWTHGLYCDEFAEYQFKDLPVRQHLGGFLPSNGVGAGFERAALERLAASRCGLVFDPECLTEDYETGYRLHALGCRQVFVPLRGNGADWVATREYFPRAFRRAVRQRSRWVTGIVLQGWQFHGWRAPRNQIYWLWRDRKGLLGNLLAPFANLLMLAGATGMLSNVPVWTADVCCLNLCLSVVQGISRAVSTARIYGWRFACGVPVRFFWGNWVNFCATAVAIAQFAGSRLRRRSLTWTKTDHAYPFPHTSYGRKRIGEILLQLRCVSANELESAVTSCPPGIRLGEHLMRTKRISQEFLYRALSIQAGMPLGVPPAAEVSVAATRLLPVSAVREWKVLPYRVAMGHLHVLTPEPPSEAAISSLLSYSALEPQFRLVLPAEFDQIVRRYVPGSGFTEAPQ